MASTAEGGVLSRPIIHPRMLSHLAGPARHFPSTCSIQQRDGSVDDCGQPEDAWVTMPSLGALPCYISDDKQKRSNEVNAAQETFAVSNRAIVLALYAPQITADMRAVVDGVDYNIREVLPDSQQAHTTLFVEFVR